MAESVIKQSFLNTVVNNMGQVGTGGLRIDFRSNGEPYYLAFYASGSNKVTLFDKDWRTVWSIPM